MAELELLTEHLNALLNQLNDQQRSKLTMHIARQIRKSQSQRITRQQDPEGNPYIPRKNLRKKKGKIRRKMFNRLKTAKFLKIEKMPNGVSIGFNDRISNIARVHQYGLVDIVKAKNQSIKVKYAQRKLLGFTESEINMTENEILSFFNQQ
ncbi:phage virion morphogenesis protein [Acinetobacter qingfengensis]|uniref:Phage virion morphogenesis protein n=1 Tax=Acinetobacter qingfengensis TaxID=1262585 RepID=A0A1E7RCL8_9GAMM|nr:phage virion morphogenesis protein [Acinetobacter qingfengensis]KAA8734917.1 phage virion morphogenesis protein [Acinetobacter qingfengensis]OEY96915.1 phage virion morphogenesis protein [Acinetobacter qingfengensis]